MTVCNRVSCAVIRLPAWSNRQICKLWRSVDPNVHPPGLAQPLCTSVMCSVMWMSGRQACSGTADRQAWTPVFSSCDGRWFWYRLTSFKGEVRVWPLELFGWRAVMLFTASSLSLPPSLLLLLTELPGRLSHGITGVPCLSACLSLSLSLPLSLSLSHHTHTNTHTHTHIKVINSFNVVDCPARAWGPTFTCTAVKSQFITGVQVLLKNN